MYKHLNKTNINLVRNIKETFINTINISHPQNKIVMNI